MTTRVRTHEPAVPDVAAVALCDGRLAPVADLAVSILDRTLQYGLGAFETMRLHGGRPFLVERHLARLRRSLESIGLAPPPPLDTLGADLVALAEEAGRPAALARIVVTAGADPPRPEAGPRVLAVLRAAPEPPHGPVRVGLVASPHGAGSPLAGVKSTSYVAHYLLRDAAEHAGRLDDLLVDATGNVTEATVSNAFGVRAGRLITPPESSGILPGVTRGAILELAAFLGIAVDVRPLPVAELASLEECFLTGAGKCLVAVDVLDERPLPAERPVASALRAALVARIARSCRVPEADVRF